MGRAPCCEKTGLKRGPWSYPEDQILITHIKLHGHGNWRALPKQAGLLRCGKSCRLRWTNYLRPDIKRGSFTKEEEDAIIQLHQNMGNRWSAIAGKLPGRTDNEIKNVWHTHLKKRTMGIEAKQISRKKKKDFHFPRIEGKTEHQSCQIFSSSQTFSSNEMSTITGVDTDDTIDSKSEFLEIDDDFWSEVLSSECSVTEPTLCAAEDPEKGYLTSFYSKELRSPRSEVGTGSGFCGDGMQFWRDLLNGAEGLPEF